MNDGDHFGAQIAERMRADAAEPVPTDLMERTLRRVAATPQRDGHRLGRGATKLVVAAVVVAAVLIGAQLGGLIGRPVATHPSPIASVEPVTSVGTSPAVAPTASVVPSASSTPSAAAGASSPEPSPSFTPWSTAEVELPADNSSRMSAATHGDDGYVAVGGGGSIEGFGGVLAWHSPDGQAWTLTLDRHSARDGSTMRDVIATEAAYVGVGDNPSGSPVWISGNGVTWSEADHPSAPDGSRDSLQAIGGGAAGLISIGFRSENDQQTATVWNSVDGRAWERLEAGDAYSSAWPVDIAVAEDGTVVIVGMTGPGQGDPVAWVVDGGSVDDPVTLPSTDPGATVASIVATPAGFTAVGSGWDAAESANVLMAWSSTDGSTWELTSAQATGSPLGASHIEGRGVVAVGATMGLEVSEVAAWELSDEGVRTILVERSNGAGVAVLEGSDGRLVIAGADDPDGAATVWIEP
jgi:hypothetical protein